MHLLRTIPGLHRVELHPDGEHAKRFEIAQWLNARGFSLKERHGTTAWGGTYVSGEQVIAVTSIPGKGDVVAVTADGVILVESKGRYRQHAASGADVTAAQRALRSRWITDGHPQAGRQDAVVPYTETTLRLAQRMGPRAKSAGIEIALVNELGQVIDIDAPAVLLCTM